MAPGVKTKFGRAQVCRYKNHIQQPKNPSEKTVGHWGRDRRAQLYRCGPILIELSVVNIEGESCIVPSILCDDISEYCPHVLKRDTLILSRFFAYCLSLGSKLAYKRNF